MPQVEIDSTVLDVSKAGTDAGDSWGGLRHGACTPSKSPGSTSRACEGHAIACPMCQQCEDQRHSPHSAQPPQQSEDPW